MSLLWTVTITFPGSLIVDVVELTLIMLDPGASPAYNSTRFFFDRRFP